MSNRLILGIAKIGDLLLNNHITQAEDNQDIYDIKLQIPEYQRPYKWTAKNANQMLDDILHAMSENKESYIKTRTGNVTTLLTGNRGRLLFHCYSGR